MKRVLTILAVNLGLLLLAALAAELIFGSWLSSDPIHKLALARDTRHDVTAEGLYPGGTKFVYRRDHWGFRGPDFDPKTVEVVSLGGSTTNQLYLPEEATWQAVMASAFAASGRSLAIVNAGIDGQSTVGHLVAVESWLAHVPGLRPRLVLVYVGINDTFVGGNVIDQMKHSSRFKWLSQNSALLRLWQSALGAVKARKARLNHHAFDFAAASWTTEGASRPELDPDPAAYPGRLRLLAERIRALGAEPVFVTQARGDWRVRDGRGEGVAASHDVNGVLLNGVDHHRRLARINALTLEVCRETGTTCLDMAGEIGFQDGDFYDGAHNTPQGAERIGRYLFEKLRSHPALAR
ncbi:hypothetical protein A6A04_05405 [Paramagnetospirillum marisnigri]|uniref:SGNH hydrolase-type esterase domain-containing protein n=1 Tax=Paramagnetospirillum marisnigri TaxID=1285242 RepID=A0A178MJG0_9PROT|nr:SGNH/GDSL hydrolase family protein [Paramagnetospirillum marisnigri]OAN48185.1 hypothetical protein A6A04_05405 [Paramagnetospirillum marisnigri]